MTNNPFDFRPEVISVLPVALAIVEQKGKFLMIQEAKPECRFKWHLPCGALQRGESLSDGMKREVLEESGIVVEPKGVMGVHRSVPEHGQYQERWRFVLVCEASGGELKTIADEESITAAYFTLEEIKNLDLRVPDILENFQSYLKQPKLLGMDQFSLV